MHTLTKVGNFMISCLMLLNNLRGIFYEKNIGIYVSNGYGN